MCLYFDVFVHFKLSERVGIQKLGACCWESSHEFTCCLELLARGLSFSRVRPYLLRGPFINDIIIFEGFGYLKDELFTWHLIFKHRQWCI